MQHIHVSAAKLLHQYYGGQGHVDIIAETLQKSAGLAKKKI